MKMKLIIAAMLLLNITSSAQNSKYEWGFMLGRSNYLGDIQPNNFTFNQGNLAGGLRFKKELDKHINVTFALTGTRLHASDSRSPSLDLQSRNLSFRTNVSELNVTLEYTFLPLGITNQRSQNVERKYRFSPFAFGGFGLFRFNPKALYNGNWIDLQPLNTEGQGTNAINNANAPYRLIQVNIPFGVGVKYAYSEKINISWELGWRKTFTDYIDDLSTVYPDLNQLATANSGVAKSLSYRGNELTGANGTYPQKGTQRGDSGNMDWYLINAISLNYKIKY
jgi:hypothetical protein